MVKHMNKNAGITVLKCTLVIVIVIILVSFGSVHLFNYFIHKDVEVDIAKDLLKNMDYPETLCIESFVMYKNDKYTFFEVEYRGQYNDLFVEAGLAEPTEVYHRKKIYRYYNGKRSGDVAIYNLNLEKYVNNPNKLVEAFEACVLGRHTEKIYTYDDLERILAEARES